MKNVQNPSKPKDWNKHWNLGEQKMTEYNLDKCFRE